MTQSGDDAKREPHGAWPVRGARFLLAALAALVLAGCMSLTPKPSAVELAACSATGGPFAAAALANAASLDTLDWSPFGAAEHGWRV